MVDIIQRVGALGVARQLNALPRSEIQKNLPPGFLEFFFDQLEFLVKTDAQGMLLRLCPEFFELVLQFDDRFLEIELMFHASGMITIL